MPWSQKQGIFLNKFWGRFNQPLNTNTSCKISKTAKTLFLNITQSYFKSGETNSFYDCQVFNEAKFLLLQLWFSHLKEWYWINKGTFSKKVLGGGGVGFSLRVIWLDRHVNDSSSYPILSCFQPDWAEGPNRQHVSEQLQYQRAQPLTCRRSLPRARPIACNHLSL